MRRRQRGMVMVWIVLLLPALIGMAALTIHGGLIWNTRTQLQGAADAAVMAALDAYTAGGSQKDARQAAKAIGEKFRAGDGAVALRNKDVELGTYDYAKRVFSPGNGFGAPAMRVTAARSKGSKAGPLKLPFGGLLGMAQADVQAVAVAAIARRDLVLVQDVTVSFLDEFPQARKADKALVNAMHKQGVPGDRMALVRFARATALDEELVELDKGGAQALERAIDRMEACQDAGRAGGPCYGTDIGAGIDRARKEFDERSEAGETERVMVIVSDGVPCIGEVRWDPVGYGKKLATEAADRAYQKSGIHIFVITLDAPGSKYGACYATDARFNESLARGYGRGYTTPRAEDLDDLLSSILQEMPVRLVR